MRNRRLGSLAALVAALLLAPPAPADSPSPTLRVSGAPDRTIAPTSLLGNDRRDVRLEDGQGNVAIYHGLSLLEVLEKNGVETKTMPAQRRLASAVVTASARDGYAVVFSVGELLMHRSDPRVYLVSETAAGPLPENEGPVRLVVYGDRARSAYALARIELKYLAENPPARKQ
jgi:hypothetical protein